MKISLAGLWELSFDKENPVYNNTIILPSTTEMSSIPCPFTKNEEATTLYLGRVNKVHGLVWYKKTIEINEEVDGFSYEDHMAILTLERTKYTKVYLDGNLIGESYETLIPQIYQLGVLTTGVHELLIAVDNAMEEYDSFPESLYRGHQYTDHTQTNWNGILGEISLTFYKEAYIKEVLLLQDEEEIESNVTIETIDSGISKYKIRIEVLEMGRTLVWSETKEIIKDEGQEVCHVTKIPKKVLGYWDEFQAIWYEVQVKLENHNGEALCPNYITITGNRNLSTKGRKLLLNGERISFRGSLDCGIYPLTGAAPYDVNEWKKIFQTVMEYGINHYRFHSWCPTEAAFIAADQLGFYLQVELSCFANGLYEEDDAQYDEVLRNYLYDQSEKIIKSYGNHPSFILYAIGNEMVGNVKAFEKLLKHLKTVRWDILYSQGANNFLENPTQCVEDDVWIMMRTTKEDNIRASFSHNDMPLGYLQGKERQGTLTNYNREASVSHVPLISHEIGQYQSFIRIEDKEKFTGPLVPDAWNIIEKRLREKGLDSLNEEFYHASGALLVACYKEEIEAALRSDEMSGFQLLGLQDFPGQGTALVGVLDSMMESKGFITPTNFRQFCNKLVVLALFPSYSYSIKESLPLSVEVYNYSGSDIEENIKVRLYKGSKSYLEEATFNQEDLLFEEIIENIIAEDRNLNEVGSLTIPLSSLSLKGLPLTAKDLEKGMDISLVLEYGDVLNTYTLWLFDESREEIQSDESLLIRKEFDDSYVEFLKDGGKMLVCSDSFGEHIEGFYTSDFWCYPMFKEACINTGKAVAPGTLGLYIDKNHRAFNYFPTKTYSEWLWQPIVMNSAPVILDEDKDVTMLVQVIDNFDRNHKLGLVYEKRIGKGRVVFIAANLLEHLDMKECYQLVKSVIEYLKTV